MPLINKLHIDFNYEAIDAEFDLFQITTSDKYIAKGAYFLDKPINSLKATALSFDYGRTAFILFKKDMIDSSELMESIGDEHLSYKKASSKDVKGYILFRLFLYSLANYRSEENSFNNLSGKLYLRLPSKKQTKKNIFALEIDVDRDMNISASSVTFTNLSVFKKNDAYNAYPKYLLEKNGKLRRVLSSDKKEEIYIKKGIPGKKTDYPFLILKPEEIKQTRVYCLWHTIEILNSRYNSFIKVRFEEVDLISTIGERRDTDFVEKSFEIVKNRDFSAVNLISDRTYDDNFSALVESLEQRLDKKIIISSSFVKNGMNVCFIHDKEFYKEGQDDPYKKIDRKAVVQCITLEDSSHKIIDDKTAVINTICKELVIKNDILNTHKISLDNWSEFGFTGSWFFGIEKDNMKYFMEVKSNGMILFESCHSLLDQPSNESMRYLSKCIDDSDSKGKSIVMDDKKNVVLLSRTNEYCLPNPSIYEMDVISRSNQTREELLTGITDINLLEKDGVQYYSSGMVGKGMNIGIPKASLLYRIDILHGENIMPLLLRSMSVMFVKYNSFTVLPYPFKYLREFIEIDESK